jgi:hypothetical protein
MRKIWSTCKKISGVLLLATGMVLSSCSPGRTDRQACIGKNGNIQSIGIPANADTVIRTAATELQRYLEKITGKELPIVSGAAANDTTHQIRFVLTEDTALKWDGYKTDIGNERIVLSANEPRGLLYAAYDLLERSGCSFVYPGESEEVVPRKDLVLLPPEIKINNPLLEHRGLAPYGLQGSSVTLGAAFISWMAKNRFNYILVSEDRPSDSDGPAHGSVWKEVTKELLPELQKRGFIIEMSEHCAPVFFPRSLFKLHPDWFALNHGKRQLGEPPYSGQMCYSNKAAVEYYADAIAAYAAKHPEFHVIGTWPLDGGEYCECKNCRDPNTVFKAAMRVAEKVKSVRPDMIVEHLAYQPQTWTPPPMDSIPSNMSVLWCPENKLYDLLSEWVDKAKHAGGVEEFEYLMGDNYHSRASVWLKPYFSASLPAMAVRRGFRGVISLFLPMQNWWRAAFNNYFFAKACWDSSLNVAAGISRYCRDYYPAQASAVNSIFDTLFTEFQPAPYVIPEPGRISRLDSIRMSGRAMLAKLDSLLQISRDTIEALRLRRIKAYIEFSSLYAETFQSGKKAGLEKLVNYSADHPDQDMVLMYPGYIRWRLEEYLNQ